jgi:hypothetical protein
MPVASPAIYVSLNPSPDEKYLIREVLDPVIKYFSSGEGLRETYLAGSGPEGLTTFGM